MKNILFKITCLIILLMASGLQAMHVTPGRQEALDDALIRAVEMGQSPATVSKLITDGANVNAVDTDGTLILMVAIAHNDMPLCQLLIEKGADVNGKTITGWTLLMHAAQNGLERICKLLIEKGADVNAHTNRGWTPLMSIAQMGNEDISKLLIEKGADVNAQNYSGWTPLMMAVSTNRSSPAVVRLFLVNNANINAQDRNGNTALSHASAAWNIEPHIQMEICKLLIKAMIRPTKKQIDPIIKMLGSQRRSQDLRLVGRDVTKLIAREAYNKVRQDNIAEAKKQGSKVKMEINRIHNEALKKALLEYVDSL